MTEENHGTEDFLQTEEIDGPLFFFDGGIDSRVFENYLVP